MCVRACAYINKCVHMYVPIIIKEKYAKNIYMMMDTGGDGEILPWKGWVEGMGKESYSILLFQLNR